MEVLAHLIEARRARALAHQLPGREQYLDALDLGHWHKCPPIDYAHPPYPRYRDGRNPLEQIAVLRLQQEAAAMPRSRVISYALFPDTISQFARRHQYSLNAVLATIGNARRPAKIEIALARRLGVSRRTLDEFITTGKREPLASLPAQTLYS